VPRPPRVSRRRLLTGAGQTIAAGALLGLTSTACGAPPEPKVDDLIAQLDLARHDSDMAAAAAAAATPTQAPALSEVASERSQHAKALENEIARTARTPVPTSTATSTSTTTAGPSAPAPGVRDVIGALRGSADSAAKLAVTESGYRAGLLGSIAASCTVAYTIALVFPAPVP
jgi:hypothetical protein